MRMMMIIRVCRRWCRRMNVHPGRGSGSIRGRSCGDGHCDWYNDSSRRRCCCCCYHGGMVLVLLSITTTTSYGRSVGTSN